MLGTALGAIIDGIETRMVNVEADVSRGLPQFSIVGLPDSAVTESKLRIRSAIRNSGLDFPQQRITVNLSPASVRKHGAGLDLPIAVAILRASGQLPRNMVTQSAFCGELTLSGNVVTVDGIVNIALGLHKGSISHLYVSEAQANEAVGLPNFEWHVVATLSQVVEDLQRPAPGRMLQFPETRFEDSAPVDDMADVLGLEEIKRGLAIAAAGGHHTVIVGPPGCGKTMVAQRYADILPYLTDDDAISSYALWQTAGVKRSLTHKPPYRFPHHSLTVSGLIGGGASVHPGEVTLAHHGVLILDELLEFKRSTLDALREPLVHREVHLARAGRHVLLPANFQLLGTLNPCPCGYHGTPQCQCSQHQVRQYWSVLSGPLLDRLDITLSIPFAQTSAVSKQNPHRQTSAQLRSEITAARANISARYAEVAVDSQTLFTRDFLDSAKNLLFKVGDGLRVSRRGLKSLERVARSISAIEGRSQVLTSDVEEALYVRGGVNIG